MTVKEAAEARGINSFDTALPQGWVDEVWSEYGYDVRGHFVMSYDKGPMGNPAPITEEGVLMERGLIAKGFHAVAYDDLP